MVAQNKIRCLVNRYCKDDDIKLVFTTFNLTNLLQSKILFLESSIHVSYTNFLVQAVMLATSAKHFSTHVCDDRSSDRSSHIFKHLQSSEPCRNSCSSDCFEIIDSASTKFQLKLKEAIHVNWEKPNLNQQISHINLTPML